MPLARRRFDEHGVVADIAAFHEEQFEQPLDEGILNLRTFVGRPADHAVGV